MGQVSQPQTINANSTPVVSSTATLTVTASITTQSASILAANANRMGLYIYNNGANTVYINFGSASSSSNNMVFPLATFTTWIMPLPIYTGQLAAIRNTGSGTLLITELTP